MSQVFTNCYFFFTVFHLMRACCLLLEQKGRCPCEQFQGKVTLPGQMSEEQLVHSRVCDLHQSHVFTRLQPRINSRYWWRCAAPMPYINVTAQVSEESMPRLMWAQGRIGVTCFSSILNCETLKNVRPLLFLRPSWQERKKRRKGIQVMLVIIPKRGTT